MTATVSVTEDIWPDNRMCRLLRMPPHVTMVEEKASQKLQSVFLNCDSFTGSYTKLRLRKKAWENPSLWEELRWQAEGIESNCSNYHMQSFS